MNKVIEIGRAVRDVELKQTNSGASVVEFSIAVKREFKSANGNYESDFFNCVSYGKTAELINQYVKQGDLFGIEGKLQTRNYTNKEGRKIYVTEIIVEKVEFLQPKKQEEDPTPNFEVIVPIAPNFEEIGTEDDLPF